MNSHTDTVNYFSTINPIFLVHLETVMLMDKENLYIVKEHFMKVKSIIILLKVKESFKIKRMDLLIMDHGVMIYQMAEVQNIGIMVLHIKDNSLMEKNMAKENISFLIKVFIKVILKMINFMDKEDFNIM